MIAVKTYGKYWENHENDPGFKITQKQMVEDIPKMIKIIPYWMVMGWIELMQDPTEAITVKAGDHILHWFMANKPQQELLNALQGYLKMMSLTSSLGGNVKVITHGAGDISEATEKPQKFQRYIQGLGAKLAKDAFNIEMIQDKNTINKITVDSISLILFWTMKGWIKFPEL